MSHRVTCAAIFALFLSGCVYPAEVTTSRDEFHSRQEIRATGCEILPTETEGVTIGARELNPLVYRPDKGRASYLLELATTNEARTQTAEIKIDGGQVARIECSRGEAEAFDVGLRYLLTCASSRAQLKAIASAGVVVVQLGDGTHGELQHLELYQQALRNGAAP